MAGGGAEAERNGTGAGGLSIDLPTALLLKNALMRLARAVAGLAAVLVMDLLCSLKTGTSLPDFRLWLAAIPCCLVALPVNDRYASFKPLDRISIKALGECLAAFAALAAVQTVFTLGGLAFLGLSELAVFFALLAVGQFTASCLLRPLTARLKRKPRVVIVGAGQHGIDVAKSLISSGEVTVEGFLEQRQTRVDKDSLPAPLLGTPDSPLFSLPEADSIIISLPNMARDRMLYFMSVLKRQPGNIYLAPDLPLVNQGLLSAVKSSLDNYALIGVGRIPPFGRFCKRIIDILLSSLVLLLFLPFGLFIGVAVKLDSPGPVFYTQLRYGEKNRLFRMYKFRTMTHDPEEAKNGIRLADRNDSRVRPLGRFLRASSLDEMPQFLNVLRGEMSIVGPRPHPPGVCAAGSEYECVIDEFGQRYKVKPGISGWAQVNGLRGSTFTHEALLERFNYDVQYIFKWSLALDLWIILKTAFGGFCGRNAF